MCERPHAAMPFSLVSRRLQGRKACSFLPLLKGRFETRDDGLHLLVQLCCALAAVTQTGFFGVGYMPTGYAGSLDTAGYPADKPL